MTVEPTELIENTWKRAIQAAIGHLSAESIVVSAESLVVAKAVGLPLVAEIERLRADVERLKAERDRAVAELRKHDGNEMVACFAEIAQALGLAATSSPGAIATIVKRRLIVWLQESRELVTIKAELAADEAAAQDAERLLRIAAAYNGWPTRRDCGGASAEDTLAAIGRALGEPF